MLAQHNVYSRPIRDIMNREVVTINAAGTIHEALLLMDENRVSTLPVVDNDDHCIGILSAADLIETTRDVDEDIYELEEADIAGMRFLLDKLSHAMGSESVQSLMSESITVLRPTATVQDAVQMMLRDRVHHLPVQDRSGLLVGIVSTMDLLREFAEAAPE
ncbi:MAG: CBS domain-containing protein [Planctomycetota bacterium]